MITVERFADFELSLEWKVGPGGNSGVFYRLTEEERAPYWTGPEMQILDDDGHADGRNLKTSAGSNYALHGPSEEVVRPAGEWNHARIVVNGSHVEHWLNGAKVVAYELWTPEWEGGGCRDQVQRMAGLRTGATGALGRAGPRRSGMFRNIKVREL